ncbi:uncharacterized protein PHALS_02894 [Plasmopara halstedii]|uniref:Uncharacterized protein n=1 Tax=Plasmopara halstedii TaxID=4781 RepID=A0A0P1AWV0_PLAHL|nr:uncharacterized protein PHALS_02894 [Plasmopara halstedii]CEG46494.1 hypothetical protein PHALS_02894 [Plasmopara halstedii]|eukprot:XP_024582863.1 hypothetical protein PHALS_02894 [Plasmopara halstedii]
MHCFASSRCRPAALEIQSADCNPLQSSLDAATQSMGSCCFLNRVKIEERYD